MTVRLPKVGNSLLEEMNPQRNYIIKKKTRAFNKCSWGAEKKSKEIS